MSADFPVPRRRGDRYTPEEIERGLVELATCGGNSARASRQLAARGLDISHRRLSEWKIRHADRYEIVRSEVIPKVHERLAKESETLAKESETLASEYAEAERDTLERYREELPNLKAGEAAGAARNLATSRGIAIDKANLLRGGPTQGIEHVNRDPSEIINQLTALGFRVFDGTCEDVSEDAEVLELAEPGQPPAAA